MKNLHSKARTAKLKIGGKLVKLVVDKGHLGHYRVHVITDHKVSMILKYNRKEWHTGLLKGSKPRRQATKQDS